MKTTLHDELVAGLTLMGCKVVPGRSKYTELEYPHFKSGHKFFVGKNGALRKGHCASNSVSIGDASNQTDFYYRLRAAAMAGVFKMCRNCAHYQDAGTTFADPKTGTVYEGRCAKLEKPCKAIHLLCGGYDYYALKAAINPECPECKGTGQTPQGARCSCIREKLEHEKRMAGPQAQPAAKPEESTVGLYNTDPALLANARQSYKDRHIFLVVTEGHIIAGADGVIARFANDEAAVQALIQAGYTRDDVVENTIFHP